MKKKQEECKWKYVKRDCPCSDCQRTIKYEKIYFSAAIIKKPIYLYECKGDIK